MAATTIEIHQTHPTYQIYDVLCFGSSVMTTVTHNPHKVTEWISRMESIYGAEPDDLLIFGLDVEWRPRFSAGHNPVATLQICFNERCLIFQIIHARYIPNSLKEFLSNRAYTFVGVGVKSDLEKLERDYQIGRNANWADLGSVAAHRYGRRDLKNKGLKDLCRHVLGKEMEKPSWITTSAWDNGRLTTDQVKYACLDALVSYEIGAELRADDLEATCYLNMGGAPAPAPAPAPAVHTCGYIQHFNY